MKRYEILTKRGWEIFDGTDDKRTIDFFLETGALREIEESEVIHNDVVKLDFLDWLADYYYLTEIRQVIWEKYITENK